MSQRLDDGERDSQYGKWDALEPVSIGSHRFERLDSAANKMHAWWEREATANSTMEIESRKVIDFFISYAFERASEAASSIEWIPAQQ